MSTSTLDRPDIDVVTTTEKGPECQLVHDECSREAVALGHPVCHEHQPPKLVCQNVLDLFAFGITVGGKCGDCFRPLADCWRFVPLP